MIAMLHQTADETSCPRANCSGVRSRAHLRQRQELVGEVAVGDVDRDEVADPQDQGQDERAAGGARHVGRARGHPEGHREEHHQIRRCDDRHVSPHHEVGGAAP
jgi:hypothetical protein